MSKIIEKFVGSSNPFMRVNSDTVTNLPNVDVGGCSGSRQFNPVHWDNVVKTIDRPTVFTMATRYASYGITERINFCVHPQGQVLIAEERSPDPLTEIFDNANNDTSVFVAPYLSNGINFYSRFGTKIYYQGHSSENDSGTLSVVKKDPFASRQLQVYANDGFGFDTIAAEVLPDDYKLITPIAYPTPARLSNSRSDIQLFDCASLSAEDFTVTQLQGKRPVSTNNMMYYVHDLTYDHRNADNCRPFSEFRSQLFDLPLTSNNGKINFQHIGSKIDSLDAVFGRLFVDSYSIFDITYKKSRIAEWLGKNTKVALSITQMYDNFVRSTLADCALIDNSRKFGEAEIDSVVRNISSATLDYFQETA